MSDRRQLTELEQARAFALAGNAHITLVSKRTGERRTYRVSKPKDKGEGVWFVSYLYGPDNESDFLYLGMLTQDDNPARPFRFFTTRASEGLGGSPSFLAFGFFVKTTLNGDGHDQLEVWHEGRCGACGRTLTVPDSIEAGLGPVCASKS